ncbi:MAG: hypothetical protein HQL38_01785 [Alphaproteobacteria bacterium]|nr:hypothetical protein [Alphaproteobacteria bacterium]
MSQPNRRHLAAVALLVLAGVTGLFGLMLWFSQEQAMAAAEKSARALALLVEQHTLRSVSEADAVLRGVAATIGDDPIDGLATDRDFRARLVGLADNLATVDSLNVADATGRFVISSRYEPDPESGVADRDYFKEHGAGGELVIGPMVLGRLSASRVFTVSRAVREADGSLRAVLVAGIDATKFGEPYGTIGLGPHSIVGVYHIDDGDIVFRKPIRNRDIGRNAANSVLFAKLKAAREGTYLVERSVIDGRARVVAYRTLDRYPLVVLAAVDHDEALAQYKARLPLTLGMAVMSLVGVAGFAATAMSHLGRAERAQSSLNAMNEILEQRVEERTALLAAALSEREEALTATQAARIRAEQADAAKERVLAAASHDLRQPLQALRLYQTVLNGMTTEPRQTLVLARMEEAMRVGESLLGSLLDASRIQAGVVTPTPTNVALGDMLDQLRSEFAIEARAAGVDLRVRPCGLIINADPLILIRILRHLISNAIKYGKGGRVLVGCRRGGGPRVVVCDQGPGIPPAEQELIFEEFYQIGNEARDRAHGLGLGLSIARKLAAICGHRLTVTSSPGGSTFALTITETSAATQALAPTSV